MATGGELILVVDDEIVVRQFLARTLQEAGFEVLAAANFSEGIRFAEARAEDLALLLSDIVMPGIDGLALAECVWRSCPRSRLLLISGYPWVVSRAKTAAVPFLAKPFTADELLEAVGAALGDAPGLQRV